MSKSKTNEEHKKATKSHGRIYTPDYLVRLILDYAGYTDDNDILCHHIIDNSCGDGAFLCEIVRRYCQAHVRRHSDSLSLRKELETFIHGIEIDEGEHLLCLSNLNSVASEFIDTEVDWDVVCGDSLTIDRFNNRMDFVVGNPPYVRVHNLDKSYNAVKQFGFARQGMTDLFIVFFEIGFRMLSPTGRMCVITPSSWLTSMAGETLRKHIATRGNLSGLIDLGHFQAFNATTYTLISRFDQLSHTEVEYNTFDENGLRLCVKSLPYSDFVISHQFFLADLETLHRLRDIRLNTFSRAVKVKNGFATLADKVFIGDFEGKFTIPVIKASTGQWRRCIFPYDNNGNLLPEEELRENEIVYRHLSRHKSALTNDRNSERDTEWYAFGRSQAIKDVFRYKIAINSLIKNTRSIKLTEVKEGEGVYSGLYILTSLSFAEISEIIVSDDFVSYVSALKNYKSSGYYTFSSKDLELYINHKIQQRDEQLHFSANSDRLF